MNHMHPTTGKAPHCRSILPGASKWISPICLRKRRPSSSHLVFLGNMVLQILVVQYIWGYGMGINMYKWYKEMEGVSPGSDFVHSGPYNQHYDSWALHQH